MQEVPKGPSSKCDAGCRGAGSSLLLKPNRIEKIVRSMSSLLTSPLTIKVCVRTDQEREALLVFPARFLINLKSVDTSVHTAVQRCRRCAKSPLLSTYGSGA